jgi:hypothetical protein
LLNKSHIAQITQCVTSTLSATLRRSIKTLPGTPVTSIPRTPAPGVTTMHRILSCPVFGIAITPTPLRGLKTLPTPIPNPDAQQAITNPVRTRATEMNQRTRQW